MKNLLTFLFCIVSLAASSQNFNWTANPADTTGGTSDQFEIVNDAYFLNHGDDTTFVWHRVSHLPEGWTNTVCDVNQCYGTMVDSAQFIMLKGDSFKIKANFYPDDIDGLGCIDLKVISLSDRTKFVTRTFCASTVASVGKVVRNNALRLFPNPASTEIQIEVKGTSTYSLKVVDALGQTVHTARNTGGNNMLNVSSWKAGIYFISIESKGFISNKSFIKY
jgi:hypothetical protein